MSILFFFHFQYVLGIGQISITPERERVKSITFSPSFGYAGYTYMVHKTFYHNVFLQFTRPFTGIVWLALGTVMLCSGVYIYIMDKWNPFNDKIRQNRRYTARDSLWHSYLIITQVGAPFGAHVYPTRIYTVFYWFFALVVVGCYTGNLASFLTASDSIIPTISIDTLPESGKRYGMLANSSVSSKYATGQRREKFYEKIKERGDFVKNYEDGVRRVKEENFILFGTSLVMTSYKSEFIGPDCLQDDRGSCQRDPNIVISSLFIDVI